MQKPILRAPVPDRRYKARFIVRNLAMLLPPLFALFIIWRSAEQDAPVLWIAFGFFVAWIAAWIAVDAWLLRRYRCPTCNRKISRPTNLHRKPAEPIRYYCARCETEWDTGLRESSDD
ncbi:MAG: hypothetical protein M3O62_10705 [Pseudomonadota bacterium]|nr:hypothetical protein [Pseudomonadota bacterium]